MTQKTMKMLVEAFDGKLYVNTKEAGVILGVNENIASRFLRERGIPHYIVGKAKRYALWEVLDAVDTTRNVRS